MFKHLSLVIAIAIARVRGAIKHVLSVCSIRHTERPWRFKTGAVFERLDGFRARLEALQNLFQSALAYSRLERIEIGGHQVIHNFRIQGEITLNPKP